MPDSSHQNRLTRSPRARLFAVATLVTGLVVASCGGSAPRPTTTAGRSSTSATTAASTGATNAGATTPGNDRAVAMLAFSKCMRANGVPTFPDPQPGGGLALPAGTNPAAPGFKAAQAKCEKFLGGGPPVLGSTTHPSAQTLAKLVRIARCMRQHGVPQFPDPRTSVPSNPNGIQEITDFDGVILLFPTTINLQAPAYRHALTACAAPPLGLRH